MRKKKKKRKKNQRIWFFSLMVCFWFNKIDASVLRTMIILSSRNKGHRVQFFFLFQSRCKTVTGRTAPECHLLDKNFQLSRNAVCVTVNGIENRFRTRSENKYNTRWMFNFVSILSHTSLSLTTFTRIDHSSYQHPFFLLFGSFWMAEEQRGSIFEK